MSSGNELRVFISSTFRDLQEEREHLVKKIFPEIRALCRERGITFTEVDLRWGLTDEDIALGQVIRTCLEEVDSCRPYFIGITGDRYGFIPSYLDIQKDPALLKQFPWIEEVVIDGMSITEMEAHYALLGVGRNGIDKPPADRAKFYFRRHRQSFQDDTEQTEELQRLEAFQERIEASGASIEKFRDPASLGEMIFDDLVTIIKRDFADTKPPTPLEQERSRHEAFSLSRRRAYIANPLYLKRLNDHVASDDPPLVVYAESGSGKSSLFAFWAEQYRRKHPEAHVIEHYVGIGATATDHYAVIRHLCMEIKERFGRDEEIPSDPAKLETALGQWLGYAEHELGKAEGGRRKKDSEHAQMGIPSSDSSFIPPPSSFVVILDGLNQLQGEALNLRWIPDVISPPIRLIISSTVEGTLVELKKRGWQQFGMQALNEAERETIVVRYLADYHKSLNEYQIKRIASDHKCGHPLFLKTVLEELRLVGLHEELGGKIDSYLEATGTEDLFQRVLERLEEDYNLRAVRDVMSLLSGSRSGLDERELSDLTGLARLKIATMIAGLDYHLVRKEGRLTFFHDYLRRAVEKRYLTDTEKKQAAHRHLAEYFRMGVSAAMAEGASVPVRAAAELAYQLNAVGAIDSLYECLATIPVFLALYADQTQYELLGYWSALEDGNAIDTYYRQGVDRWKAPDGPERSTGVGRVVDLLCRLGRWTSAIELCRERLSSATARGDKVEEATSRRSHGWLLQLRGAYDEALHELARALDLYTELGDRRGVAMAHGNMGIVYGRRGEFEQALERFDVQLRISEELGDRIGVAYAQGNIGNVYYRRGKHERALEGYGVWLRISMELGDRLGVASVNGNMGIVYAERGEHERALESYRVQLRISEELGDRPGVGMAQGNMGIVYAERGEYERALECYGVRLRICEELGDRAGIANAQGNMGIVYLERGEHERALECLGNWLLISEELGEGTGVANAQGNMGNVFFGRGESERALNHFRTAATKHRQIGFRYGLTYWLSGTASVLLDLVERQADTRPQGSMPDFLPEYVPGADEGTWRSLALRTAREQAEECVAISEELSKQGTLFKGRVLIARIEAAEGRVDSALQRLGELLMETTDDEERAEIHYRLWKLSATDIEDSPRRADHRAEALRLYQSLVEKIPKQEYRTRIEQLGRTH